MPDTYCVMGHPIAHSRSPWIHARFAQLTGQSLYYDRLLVPLDGLAQALHDFAAQGGKGCNITVPFKFEAIQLAQHVSARAALAQASNTLSWRADGLHADNTDGVGLVRDIERNAGLALADRDVLLLGAGGAAAGVLGPLLQARVRRLDVVNRTLSKAQVLVQRHSALASAQGVTLQALALDSPQLGRYDLLINASTSSLAGAPVPVPAHVLRTGALALDMMYGPAAQGFLAWAQAEGAQARDGLGMLVEQAGEAFAIWRGVHPPCTQVLAELREQLGHKT